MLSHHFKLSIFLVVHNLFEKGLRKISLNTSRFIITANLRDQSQINYLSRQAFPGSRNFLSAVYNHILTNTPYGYLVLDFSQNRSKFLRITTRWFSNENIMAFTENSLKCSSDNFKRFTCYHIISDNIFKLLTSKQNQNDENINTNKSSIVISGLEPPSNRYISNNPVDSRNQQQYDTDGDTINPTNPEMDNTHTQTSHLTGLDSITQTDQQPLIGIDNITQTNQPVVKTQSSQTFTPEHNIKNQQIPQQTIIKHPTKPITTSIKPLKPISRIKK